MSNYKNILISSNGIFFHWEKSIKKVNNKNIIFCVFLKNILINVLNEKNIDYIIPLNDNEYQLIKNITLKNNEQILYPDENTITLLHNKMFFTKFMMDNFNNYIPKVYYLDNKQINDIKYPAIYKPIYSTCGKNMSIIYSDDELIKINEKHIIQKFIEDEYEYGAFMVCVNGTIASQKIIRYKYKKFNIKTETFPKNHEIVQDFDIKIFGDIIQKLHYSGGINFDFKYDINTNNIYIFEINPRFGGSAFTCDFISELLCITV